LQNLEKDNNLNRQCFKDKTTMTTPERKRSKAAKKNKKEILGPLKAMSKKDEDGFVDIMASVIAPGEQSLSQTPLKTTPNTTIRRLRNAMESDSDDEDDKDSEE